MNTLAINATKPSLAPRFAWKEYRMLRGLWLASAIIAVVIQMLFAWSLAQYRQDLVNALFTVAWSAAALYAVGAAITMFAAETEEHTRDYLRLLPGDWRPIFATKVVIAFASAVLLGMSLTLTGAWLAGALPSQRDALYILGVAGVAMLEFLAWGLLFSLWWKHPLLAAVAAMAAASFGAQWAILSTTSENNSWTAEAYVAAVPARLAICLLVLAVDVWLGRRWLYPVPNAKPTSGRAKTASGAVAKAASGVERPRLKMFGRLLWQTWRESWKVILVALPLSIGLITAFMAPASLLFGVNEKYALWLMTLILPAIVGSLAFRADQKKDHRLFLATHAAWPRYIWLARHTVWLGTVVLLGMVATAVVGYLFQTLISIELLHTVRGYERYGYFDSHGSIANSIDLGRQFLRSGIATAWCAVVSAYAVGQLCSMLLKQTVLSGFAALLLSVVLAAWSVLMFAWQMNPFLFVLPIGIGAMFATWLRAPSWILEQNRWKHWVAPVAAIALPAICALAFVPSARMAQIEDIELPAYHFLREPLDVSVQKFNERLEQQRESLLKLEQLGIAEEPLIEEVVLDGKTLADFELSERALEFYRPFSYGDNSEQLDPAEVEILDRFQAEATRQGLEANRAKIPELLAIVNSPGFTLDRINRHNTYSWHSIHLREQFAKLLADDAKLLSATGDLAEAWQRLRAIPLLGGEYYQRTTHFNDDVIAWASHPDQTSDLLKRAITDLQEVFAKLTSPRDVILANSEHVKGVVTNSQPSRQSPANSRLYHFLNDLPGEQQRALRGLDLLTARALNQIDTVTAVAVGEGPQLGMALGESLGDLLRAFERGAAADIYDGHSKLRTQELEQAFATSFLAARDFNYDTNPLGLASNWVAEETLRRGLLLQLGLIAYEIDHGAYPEFLTELRPDYLPARIDDPFSGQAFLYRPEGLAHKLLSYQGDKIAFIEPHTPLVWSVGYDNMQLMEARPMDFIVKQYGGPSAVDEKILAAAEAGEEYYFFRGTQRGGSNRYVFPLPKVEAEEEETNDEVEP